jgi:hypothetical protein
MSAALVRSLYPATGGCPSLGLRLVLARVPRGPQPRGTTRYLG